MLTNKWVFVVSREIDIGSFIVAESLEYFLGSVF